MIAIYIRRILVGGNFPDEIIYSLVKRNKPICFVSLPENVKIQRYAGRVKLFVDDKYVAKLSISEFVRLAVNNRFDLSIVY